MRMKDCKPKNSQTFLDHSLGTEQGRASSWWMTDGTSLILRERDLSALCLGRVRIFEGVSLNSVDGNAMTVGNAGSTILLDQDANLSNIGVPTSQNLRAASSNAFHSSPRRRRDEAMLLPVQPRTATAADLVKIKSFLGENGLPDVGVDGCVQDFVIAEDEKGRWVGVAGLESYGESALLRSVAVDERFRGRGHGRILVETVLGNARDRGIKTVYLLTGDAAAYFERLGFRTVDRKDIDDAVKKSSEFTEACCESAVAMRKAIR